MRISKANQKLQQQLTAQRQVQHFGLRKLSVGVASVLLSTSLYFGATSVAHAASGTPSVNTETVTSGVPNQASTATLPEPAASEAPVDDKVDQRIPSSAVGHKDATLGGAPVNPVDDEVDQKIPSSAVGHKDATPGGAPKFLILTAAPDSTAKTTPQYDINDLYNFYHDKKSDISKDRLQKLVDYKNNLASVTAILNLKQTDYGSNWVDQALEKQIAIPETFTDAYVDRIVSTLSQKLVKDTKQKIDAQLVKLAALQNQYPNNPDVKKAIDELTNAKAMVTPDTILDANRMESVIETLNKYSSKDAYNKLEQEAKQNPNGNNQALDEAKKNAKAAIENLKNLNQAQKEAALAQVKAATTVDAANNYANTAKTLDSAMKDLADTAAGADTTSGNYTNADADKQAALQKAIADAQTLAQSTTEAADADKVAAAKQAIEDAQAALNGNDKLAQALDEAKKNAKAAIENLKNLNQAQKEAALAQVKAATTVDEAKNYATTAITLDDTMGALQKAVTDGNNGKVADPKYYNADATTRAAYDKALSNAQAVLDDANATQAQIDQAKADLSQAAEALTGKATDKSALQATYNQANVAAKTTAYTNANNTIKRAYEKALSEAQAVLADANATQAQVDLAKAALDDIMALLKGASGDATVAKNSSDQSDQNGLSKAATAIDGKNTTSTTSSASKQNQLPQTGNTKNDAAVAGLGLASLLAMLGLGGLKKKRN